MNKSENYNRNLYKMSKILRHKNIYENFNIQAKIMKNKFKKWNSANRFRFYNLP